MKHYHDFFRSVAFSWGRFTGVPFTAWTCSCGIKTWRRANVTLLQSRSEGSKP